MTGVSEVSEVLFMMTEVTRVSSMSDSMPDLFQSFARVGEIIITSRHPVSSLLHKHLSTPLALQPEFYRPGSCF